jgi:putative aminopeptidase FrvX
LAVDTRYMVDVLVRLCKTPSPSGSTERAICLVEQEFLAMGFKPQRTRKGSLLVTIPGADKTRERALSAHVDTLGAMVRDIKANGRIKFAQIGGYMMQSVEGEYVTIETSSGRQFTGTILSIKPSTHVYRDADKLERTLDNMEIRLDEKVFSAADVRVLGIEVGDFVTFDPRTEVTESGFVKSRHLDDKAGVAIILGAARHFSESGTSPATTMHLYVSNYEEVGHGAAFGIPLAAEELIAVDMGAMGDGQSTDEHTVSICAKDSSGPYDKRLREHLVSLAKARSIGYKVDIYPFYGSDASAALRAGANLRASVVGPGVDASHAFERTHKEALFNTCALMVAYMEEA